MIRYLEKLWSSEERDNYYLELPPDQSIFFCNAPEIHEIKSLVFNEEFEVCGNIGSNWIFCCNGTRTRSFSKYQSMLTFHTHCKDDSFFSLVDWFSFARSSAKSSILFSKNAMAIYTKRGNNIVRLAELYSENEQAYKNLPNMKYIALSKRVQEFIKLDDLDGSPLTFAHLLDVELEVFYQ
tara:strand:- start:191 stop:733 length:543 start_codon:yes stop_codon:yes gene_type:complete